MRQVALRRSRPARNSELREVRAMLLADKVVLITGASGGIGAATALEVAAEGAAVGVNYYRSEAAAHDVVREIESRGGRALALQADVRDGDAIRRITDRLATEYGGFDALVLNDFNKARSAPSSPPPSNSMECTC